MKLLIIFLALLPFLLHLAAAAPCQSSADHYGRIFRNSRMSHHGKNQYQDVDDEEGDDDADDEEADDDADDDIYPPDFNKLFPNPDNRPAGPNSYNDYVRHHPANMQPSKPAHGPASSPGPASLRGPPQAQHGQKQGGVGPYASGSKPVYHDAPPPNYQSGPPPSRRGPPPQYRNDIETQEEEIESPELGRAIMYGGGRRVVGVPNRRVAVAYYPNRYNYNRYTPVSRPVYQMSRYPSNYQNRVVYRPRYYPRALVNSHKWMGEDDEHETFEHEPSYTPHHHKTHAHSPMSHGRAHGGRVYNPWARNPAHPDPYNPQFVVNPTMMRSRRVFRYHPSQRVPVQKIPLYSGYWESRSPAGPFQY